MSATSQLLLDFNFQDEFVFDNFVVSDLDVELLSVFDFNGSDKGKKTINLTEQFYFIWGAPGAGKSHFLQALCQEAENAVYLPLRNFSEYGPEIFSGLENMDLICLDDLDCVLGKLEWEEALFHFYNLLRDSNKRLIISANKTPRHLTSVLPDLLSRLAWGVCYQLHEPGEEGKTQALKIRAKKRGIPLKDEVLNYILLRSSRSMESLFAVLDQLDKVSLTQKRRITIPFVKELMNW